ncbi:hypothetical protein BGX24_008816 [Mortierella sp. AD032]|nr:hypothetical protein BGX24_008816 [Mortierella sp. AD032]
MGVGFRNFSTIPQEVSYSIIQSDDRNELHDVDYDEPTRDDLMAVFYTNRGADKTFLYNALIAYFKGVHNKNLIVVASSDMAFLNLIGGRITHTCIKVPIPIFAESTCNLANRMGQGQRI